MAALPISNKECLPWIVQKFGGTSVGKFLENITDTIVRYVFYNLIGFINLIPLLNFKHLNFCTRSHLETHRVALVCSARSSNIKAEGTTNRLFKASEEALKHGSKEYLRIVDEIYEDHVKASREIIIKNEILKELENQLLQDCTKLKSFLDAAQVR